MADTPEVAERRRKARFTALKVALVAVGVFVMFIVIRGIA